MKITALLLLVGCLQLSANGLTQTISLTVTDAPLQKVFTAIEKQTDYRFFYNFDLLKNTNKITLAAHSLPLQSVLELIFKNQPVTYTIHGNVISISAKKHDPPAAIISPVPINIKGRVVNEHGEPVLATVTVKGTNQGTSTNENGEFILTGVEENAVLLITGVGIESKEIPINSNPMLHVTVKIAVTPLEESVIKGYYTTTRRLNTGNVSKITSETISQQPVSNSLAALEGRVPSLDITQNTGMPGGGFSVQIRGKNSISNGNDPLYIIDGVPFTSTPINSFFANANLAGGNPLSSFNPSDIESIEVLKDADATAIYGSRGANGVILITTKKGAAGKTKFDFNFYQGMAKVPKKMDLLSTRQYLDMRHEAFKNDGAVPDSNVDYDLTYWDTSRYTDWQKSLIGGTGHITDAQISASGGTANTRFLIGGGYHRETTVFPDDFSNKKVTSHFNLSHATADQRFKILLTGGYAVENNNLPQADLTQQAITLPPDAPPIYDSAGDFNWANSTFTNPYANILLQKFKTTTNNLIGNLSLNYELIHGLFLKANLGYTNLSMSEIETAPTNSWLPAWNIQNGLSYFSDSYAKTWLIEPQLAYEYALWGGHLSVLAGATFQESKTEGQVQLAQGYVSNALLESIAGAAKITLLSSNYALYRYNALFGRLNYNWKDKYLINLTARRDGSSRFGPGKQFGNFGAAGAAWIFTQEPFVKDNLSFLSFGKIRGSYGVTGNDQISDYQFLSTYMPTPNPYNGNLGLLPARLYNPDFAWETNKKLEGGVELGFLKNQVYLSVSYYRNRSGNQLVGYPLSAVAGFTSIQYNLPALVENKGWEFQVTSTNIKTTDFEWSSAINLTIPSNKLISFPDIKNSSYAKTYVEGKSLFVKMSFPYIGVNPQTGVYEFTDQKGDATSAPMYPDDLKPVGELRKKYYGGLNNTLRYKGIEFTFFFQFVKQTGWAYLYGGNQLAAPGMMGNQPTEVLNRWQNTGDVKGVQQFTSSYSSDAFTAYSNTIYYGENRLTDASYIRLRNAFLSYQLPDNIKQKLHLQNCSVYLMGQNLLTITNYLGLDPETQSLIVLPPLRTVTAGIRFTL